MSTTTGFDLAALTELVNEQEFGTLWYKEPLMQNNTFIATDMHGQILTGAKNNEYKLPTMESTATVKDGSTCGFEPTDQTTIDQTDLSMVALTIQGQFCVREIEPFFMAAGLPAGQHYTGFNPLEAQMLARIAEQIGKKMAIFPYYGPTGTDTATYPTNWVSQLEAAININIGIGNSTNGGPSGTDAAGAFNRVNAMKASLLADADSAAGVYTDGEYTIEMSPLDADLYFQNLVTLEGQNTLTTIQAQYQSGSFTQWIHPGTRIKVIVVNALQTQATRNIILWRKQNKVLAFDLRSDATRLEMGMDQYREFIWWKWRAKIGTGIRAANAQNVLYTGDLS